MSYNIHLAVPCYYANLHSHDAIQMAYHKKNTNEASSSNEVVQVRMFNLGWNVSAWDLPCLVPDGLEIRDSSSLSSTSVGSRPGLLTLLNHLVAQYLAHIRLHWVFHCQSIIMLIVYRLDVPWISSNCCVYPSYITGKSITHFNCDQNCVVRSNGKELIASLPTTKSE